MPHHDLNGHVYFELPANQPDQIRLWQIRIVSLDPQKKESDAVYIGVHNARKEWESLQVPGGFYGLSSSGVKFSRQGVKANKHLAKKASFGVGDTVVAAYDGNNKSLRIFCSVAKPGGVVNGSMITDGGDAASDRLYFAVFLRGKNTAIEVTRCDDVHKSVLKFLGHDTIPCAAIRRSMLGAPCIGFETDIKYHSKKLNAKKYTVKKQEQGGGFHTVLCGYSGANVKIMSRAKAAGQKTPDEGWDLFRLRFKTVAIQNLGFVAGFLHSPEEVNDWRREPRAAAGYGGFGVHGTHGHGEIYVHGTANDCNQLAAHIGFPRPNQEWMIEFDFERNKFSLYLREQNQWMLAAEQNLQHRSVIPTFTLISSRDVIQIL